MGRLQNKVALVTGAGRIGNIAWRCARLFFAKVPRVW